MSVTKTFVTAAAMVICLLPPSETLAQATTPAPTPVASTPQRFLGLDLFGGVMGLGSGKESDDGESGFDGTGWEVGGTVRFRPWLGVTGTFARTTSDAGERLYHFLAGPRVNTDIGGEFGSRAFAHVLLGGTSARGPSAAGGYELVIGGGFDTFAVMRLQFDYVRVRSGRDYRNGARSFFGGVIPLCFRGCRPGAADGFEIR